LTDCQQFASKFGARVVPSPLLPNYHPLSLQRPPHSTRLTRQAEGGRRQRSHHIPIMFVSFFPPHRRVACGRLRTLVIPSRKVSLLYDAGWRSPAISVSGASVGPAVRFAAPQSRQRCCVSVRKKKGVGKGRRVLFCFNQTRGLKGFSVT
jgi:hypothetical protein